MIGWGRRFVGMGLLVVMAGLAACGTHRMPPVDPRASGELTPAIEDGDAGLVGVAAGFDPKAYRVIVVQPFTVSATEIKDEEDARLAKDMAAYLHAQMIRRLQDTRLFAQVVDGAISAAPSGPAVLRLEGDITRLTEGDRALRYFVGFGAGAAKAQIESRLVDAGANRIQLVTADRRAAGMGIFGGDGRQFLTASMDEMAEGYVNLLRHLAGGGRPGPR